MPATPRQIERYWTEPPDDEPPMQTCPDCEGEGWFDLGTVPCERCETFGTIPVEPDEDAAYERAVN